MWAKRFLNLAAECLFNFGLSQRDWSKQHEVYHLQWICFDLNLGRLGRSNQVKSKKELIS